jgi:hypothetical protein
MQDAIKGIGNSVPVTVGFSLGKELLKILVAMHEKEQQRRKHLTSVEIPEKYVDRGHGEGSKDDPITVD